MVVSGGNLLQLYNPYIQERMGWLKAAAPDFAKDGEPIILTIEVVGSPQHLGISLAV